MKRSWPAGLVLLLALACTASYAKPDGKANHGDQGNHGQGDQGSRVDRPDPPDPPDPPVRPIGSRTAGLSDASDTSRGSTVVGIAPDVATGRASATSINGASASSSSSGNGATAASVDTAVAAAGTAGPITAAGAAASNTSLAPAVGANVTTPLVGTATVTTGGSAMNTGTGVSAGSGMNASGGAAPVNGVQYKLTPGGTYVPGFSPSGGVSVVGAPVEADVSQQRPQNGAAQAPPVPIADRPVTTLEALDGLTYSMPGEITNHIGNWKLIDSANVFNVPQRRDLRSRVIDSPVATGSQNLLTQYLRSTRMIQPYHIVVGVIPRKNAILIGRRSSEEQ